MEKEEKKKVSVKDEVGKFFLDVAKLIFAGLVLGTVVRGNIDDYVVLFGGLVATVLCFGVGLLFIYNSRREK
jgi:hypothetical protein